MSQKTARPKTPAAAARKKSKKSAERRKPAPAQTKKQIAIALLKKPKGASLAEMQRALGWQQHSVRGFLAGTVRKMPGVALLSEKTDDGPRRYRVVPDGK